MSCRYCGRPVQLSPTAAERAAKLGGRAQDYTALFPDHADCVLKARQQGTVELLRRLNAGA